MLRHYYEVAEQAELLADQYSWTKGLFDFAIVSGSQSDSNAPRPVSVSLAAHRNLLGSLELVGGKRAIEAECLWGTRAVTWGLVRSEEKPAIDWT